MTISESLAPGVLLISVLLATWQLLSLDCTMDSRAHCRVDTGLYIGIVL